MNNHTLDFLTKLMMDTLKVDLHYFIEPYNDFAAFDRFFRNSLGDSNELYQTLLSFIPDLDHDSFHIYTDTFGLSYVFFFPYDDKRNLISIGPYFSKEISEEYWSGLMELHKLTLSNIQNLKGFLYGIPVIPNNLQLISIAHNILNYVNPSSSPYTVKYHDTEDELRENELHEPKIDFDAYYKQVSERYRFEKELLSYISTGNKKKALEAAENFLNFPIEPRMNNFLRDHKSLLVTANTLFRKAVEPNEIHPIYLHEISSKFVNLIENANSPSELNNLYEKMIREYCYLVQTKSTKQYSLIVQRTLHNIEFNLFHKLNLGDLADELNISVPYLSTQFKKETGNTIIRYINQLRIQTSLKLLKSSTLSVQDIAGQVGIYDYNYFTKVFKKEIGVTPTEFRKQFTREEELPSGT